MKIRGPKMSPKKTASQYHPGALAVLVKPKSAFSTTQNASNRFLKIIQWNFLLTNCLPASACLQAIMTKVTGLIFSLFDAASSQDMPFGISQYIQCMHHGLTFILPLHLADSTRCCFAVVQLLPYICKYVARFLWWLD